MNDFEELRADLIAESTALADQINLFVTRWQAVMLAGTFDNALQRDGGSCDTEVLEAAEKLEAAAMRLVGGDLDEDDYMTLTDPAAAFELAAIEEEVG